MIVKKDDFLKNLKLASRFVASRLSSNVLLSGVYLKKEKKLLHFYSTNLNFYFHSILEVKDEKNFDLVVEPKNIIDFLSYLNKNEFDLLIEDKKIVIKAEKNQGEFPLFPKEDFPLPPTINEKQQEIKKEILEKNLPLVLFACASDESRPVLTGVNFVSEDEKMLLVGTDGFRLSLLKVEKEIDLPNMIVSASFLREVLGLLTKEEKIFFSYSKDEKAVYFKIDNIELYSRIIEGEYPPFEKVIPTQEGKTKLVVEKESFLQNLKLISVFSRELSNIVILDIKKDGVYLRPKTEEETTKNQAFLEAYMKGEEIKVAFNIKFLLEFLNHVLGERILIEILRPDAPVSFKDEEKENFLHIIMPVRIS
jgi:DNA polymerase-3 subunit beta